MGILIGILLDEKSRRYRRTSQGQCIKADNGKGVRDGGTCRNNMLILLNWREWRDW